MKYANRLFLALLWALLGVPLAPLKAQQPAAQRHDFSVAFYNVENLFDTVDDPAIDDEEFLPDSPRQWTADRYRLKQTDVAKVIAAIPVKGLPDILGLCEVENRTVLLDLVKTEELALAGYMMVHTDSPDRRGIDVALLYKPDRFRTVHEETFTAPLANSGNPTRDVLYVKGLAMNSDTLHVFVNHWPSRYGGAVKSEPNRIGIAQLVRARIDSVLQVEPNAKIVVMGDFNDNPTDTSVNEVLGAATMPDETELPLFNLHARSFGPDRGTFNYRGTWNMLDQIIVSWGLRDATHGLSCPPGAGHILREPFMIYTSDKGMEYPNKTYGGDRYYGGISDHLPVYAKFTFRYQ